MTSKTLHLRTVDLPLFNRFGVGFDSVLDELERINAIQGQQNYPPYNLVKLNDNDFVIEVAVAGFDQGEIDVTVEKSILTVKGESRTVGYDDTQFVHKGIAARDFTRTFTLAEHVEIVSAEVTNGILSIKLERKIPESAKPKAIAITYNR